FGGIGFVGVDVVNAETDALAPFPKVTTVDLKEKTGDTVSFLEAISEDNTRIAYYADARLKVYNLQTDSVELSVNYPSNSSVFYNKDLTYAAYAQRQNNNAGKYGVKFSLINLTTGETISLNNGAVGFGYPAFSGDGT